ncbi:hypothetical protein KI387_000441, partial [Taxus chinensis]
MGANLSRVYEGDEGISPAAYPGLADIPENCIAGIFRHLSPLDICKLARLNRAFKGAASCDLVWAQKLPACYQEMLSKVPLAKGRFLMKKEIYALLCKPISLENGTKEVWLDKATGGVCLAISARAMSITGIDDHRYWRWIPCEESSLKAVSKGWSSAFLFVAFDRYTAVAAMQEPESFRRMHPKPARLGLPFDSPSELGFDQPLFCGGEGNLS